MAFGYAEYGADVGGILRRNARRLDTVAARAMRPPPRMDVAEWAAKYRRFPDDAPYGGRWKHETAIYLVEIMEAGSPEDPCEEVDIKKCAQSGGTAAVENAVGHASDIAPGPMMYVQATFHAALDWAEEKLWPMIEATPRLNPAFDGATILPVDGKGSKKTRIKFARGGYLLLAGANSAPSLRQHTVRYAIEDDVDQFPDDLNKQGSPEAMVGKRLTVYRKRGLSKRWKISTPTLKGASKVDSAYQASDQRHFYFKCPHCSSRFDPIWSDITWPKTPDRPEEAYLVAPCCGGVIEHAQKSDISLKDGWLARNVPGLEPPPRFMSEEDFQARRAATPPTSRKGFWISGIISAFMSWSDLAVGWIAAQGDVNNLKTWFNLDYGDVFELKGAAPDYEKLRDLREQDWGVGRMPAGVVVVTMAVDVQGDGLYVEQVGHGPNDETWSLLATFIPGMTDVPGEGAWKDLDALSKRGVVYPGGRTHPIDFECVDAGYHTIAAEAYCRMRPNRLAVFGRAGWTLPVLGRGENIRYTHQGKNAGRASKRADDKAYIVGTFGVKATWYGFLRATLQAATHEAEHGELLAVRGRCHFSRDTPDQWFEQVTSETVEETEVNGIKRREWKPMAGRPNHWLDCRVYNYAAAEKLLLATLSDADWARLKTERYAAPVEAQGDLLANLALAPHPPAANPVREDGPPAPVEPGWLEHEEDWI